MSNKNLFLIGVFALFMWSCGGEPPKKTSKPTPKPTIESTTTTSPAKAKEEKVVESKPTPKPKAKPIPANQLKKAKALIASVSEADIAAVDAKKKYKLLCAACHGFKGDLNVNGAKDLTISTVSLEESVAQVYHGRGLMTPFKGIMKDAEIIAVAKYIETLR